MYSGIIFIHKGEWNYVLCRKLDGTGDHHGKLKKTESERHMLDVFTSYVESRRKEYVCRMEMI
jgi:hypothetical protein